MSDFQSLRGPISAGVAALLALLLGACSAMQSAGMAYDDAFGSLEGIGRFDKWRQEATPAKLLVDGHPESLVEIGRRFEVGAGLPRDRDCAAWWYERAHGVSYQEPRYVYSSVLGSQSAGTITRSQYPRARLAYRKLLKAGPVTTLTTDQALTRCESFSVSAVGGPRSLGGNHERTGAT